MSKSRKKQKKASDLSRSCSTCSFSSKSLDGNSITCGLDAVEVSPDSSCPRFGQEIEANCQHCGKNLKFKDRAEFFSFRTLAKIDTAGGTTAQAFTLCPACQLAAQQKFGELLDWMIAACRAG